MSLSNTPRTAEHVSQAHPDKFADQVADSILDAALEAARQTGGDEASLDHPRQQRTAIEILAKDRLVVVSGEVRFGPAVASAVDVSEIVRRVWKDVGYQDPDSVTVVNHLQRQSPELTVSSTRGDGANPGEGAGDQGIMVGYATDETPTFMPPEWQMARDLCRRIEDIRLDGLLPWLRADAKTQVTLDDSGRPARVVIAAQHAADYRGTTLSQDEIKNELMARAVRVVLGEVSPSLVVVNGTKSFVVGGTIGDAGVVGRKIVVDAYGPTVPVGGGAYSGKDPTKVDRSAAYMARHIAKTAVAKRVRGARKCTVHIAYCIGKTAPDMVTAITDTGVDISDWVTSRFPDLSPRAVIEHLGLLRADQRGETWSYRAAAAFGHYGRSEFPWEAIAELVD